MRLMTIFYFLRFETSLFFSYYSQGYGGGIRLRPHTVKGQSQSQSQSQSHIATEDQSSSKSWSSPMWGSWPDMYYSLTITVFFCEAPCLTRGKVCLLYLLLVLASVVFLGSESLSTRDHILLSQIWDFPFRRLLRLAGSRWRYTTPCQRRVTGLRFICAARKTQKISHMIASTVGMWRYCACAEVCLQSLCVEAGCITSFHYCVHVSRGVYRSVT
jgi:hypothetical protein